MAKEIDSTIQKHKLFWEMARVDRPLTGYCLGGWGQFQMYPAARGLFPKGPVTPEMVRPEVFLKDYQKILEEYALVPDDLLHAVEPLPLIPWIEAVMGCPVCSSGENVWAEPFSEPLGKSKDIRYDPDSAWVKKYMEFIDFLTAEFGSRYPVAQALLRGPADMVSAGMGNERFLYALLDNPDKTFKFAEDCAELQIQFLRDQMTRLPAFHNGYVIGQFHLWAPDRCIRLQEDAAVLLSPDLYKRFFWELDRKVAGVAEFNLLHIHTASLFLLDLFLEIEELKTIQVSLDVGGPKLGESIDQLKRIQTSGKRLMLKGGLDAMDVPQIKELDTRALCLQVVVENRSEIEKVPEIFANNKFLW